MTDEQQPTEETESATPASAPRPGAQAASRARRIGGRPMPGPDRPTPTGRRPSPKPKTDAESADLRAQQRDERARIKAEQAVEKAERKAELRAERLIAQEGQPAAGWLLWFPAVVAGVLAAAMIGVTIWQADGVWWNKPATSASASVRTQVLAAAKTCGVAVTSYDYRKFDASEQAGVACATGDFTTQYKQAMEQTIKSLAVKSQTVQTTVVAKAGVQSVDKKGDQWVILVFGQQVVTNAVTGPNSPRLDQLTMQVTMTKVAGGWRVSDVQLVS